MTEKNMQTFFSQHVKANPPKVTEAYELKICKGTSLAFDSVKDHQKLALLNATQGAQGMYHKITDQPWIKDRPYSFTSPKPFDCFVLKHVDAYVVIWFYKERQKKLFYKVKIKDYLDLENRSTRKSFTEEMIKEVCSEVLYL